MTQLPSLLVLALPLIAACTGPGNKYRVAAGPIFTNASGVMALQNASGNLNFVDAQNDLDDDLGLGDTETSPYLRAQWDKERHRVRLHGFAIDAESTGTLSGDYGGIPAGSPVNTSMDFFAIGSNYGYQILRGERYRVAVGGALTFYSLDVAARSSAGREEVVTEVAVPMPFVEAEWLLDTLTIGANGSLMVADLGDAAGRYLDVEAYAQWQFTKSLEAMVGYRYLVLDAYGTASSRRFDADIDIQGFFVTLGVVF